MDMLIALLLFIVLLILFFSTYLMNKRTPIPEGIDLSDVHCKGCRIVECQHNDAHKNERMNDNGN